MFISKTLFRMLQATVVPFNLNISFEFINFLIVHMEVPADDPTPVASTKTPENAAAAEEVKGVIEEPEEPRMNGDVQGSEI